MAVQTQSGARIGDCILGEQIGKGGMGVVFRAKQAPTMRDVVVKVISPENVHPSAVKSFQKEVTLLANLHHPHILPVYTAGIENGVPYVVMQYVDGGDLSHLIMRNDGPLDVKTALQITVELASALTAAHELGFVHRDVKPGNVLIANRPFRALLADFGLATVAGEQGMSYYGAGTPGFWAPEQWQGRALDARTDVYALAATLYWMLALQVPQVANGSSSKRGKAIAIREADVKAPRTTVEAIQRGLSPDPQERHASAQAFADDASQGFDIHPGVWMALGAAGLALLQAGIKRYQSRRAEKQALRDGVIDAEVIESESVPVVAGPIVCTHCGRVPRDPTRERCSQCGTPLH